MFEEKYFNQLGLYFTFKNDTLNKLQISKYGLKTEKEITPQTTQKTEIIEAYGTPFSIESTYSFLDIQIQNVEVLKYDGISFILLNRTLMLIEIN